ncbi:MAG: exodeoxyribonuclease VII large subunit [Acidimicrobiales bacterium]
MSPADSELVGLFPDQGVDALSVSALFQQVQRVIAAGMPRGPGVWIRGEIQKISEHRSGHCYLELVDPDVRGRERPMLQVNCWRTTWGPLKAVLSGQGVTLEAGMVVTLRGRVEAYAPRSQLSFIANQIDVAAILGRLAAQRAALLKALETEGLLRRNATLAVPPVPLRVGLVASPATEGYNDFAGQVLGAGLGFELVLYPVQVQGARAPLAIAAGLAALARRRCDVTVLVRGGGAKADLVAFEHEAVARAVATHPVPVWTGIGHTGDRSVADIVAHSAFITPTECGQELVRRVRTFWDHVSSAGERIGARADESLEQARHGDDQVRHRLSRGARHQLHRHGEHLGRRAGHIGAQATRQLDTAAAGLERRADRLAPRPTAVLDRQGDRVVAWRRLLAAYDVERQLERGYSLTLDAQGNIVRSVAALAAGDEIVTRLSDGTAGSTVGLVTPAPSGEVRP